MTKIIDTIKTITTKVGKRNLILIIFIFLVLGIVGLYQTFSLYTSSDGISMIDGIKTYKFILTGDSENSVTIAAGSSKYLAITVTNPEELALKYSLYYSTSSDLEKINIGYLESSEYKGTDIIKANQDYIVNCRVTNMSDSAVTINFGVKYGFNNEEAIVLESNQNYLEKFKVAYLVEAKAGDYITYLGRNGCDFASGSCGGVNPGYAYNSTMGYCANSSRIYNSIGWRLAYIDDSIPYLVSAGSPECMCTLADGTPSTSCADGDTTGTFHIDNLNNQSLTYCNSNYAYNDSCNSNTAWNFGVQDFNNITGNNVTTFTSCSGVSSSDCGLGNNLIDVGGHYWSAVSASDVLVNSFFARAGGDRVWTSSYPHNANGLRPILKLQEDIMIISGDGTSDNPYRIATEDTKIEDLSGNGNHAINQDAGWDKTNGNVVTDSTTTYIDAGLPNYDFGNSITLVAKVKFNTLSTSLAEQHIFGNWETGGTGLSLQSGKLSFSLYTNGGYKIFYSTVTPTAGTWYTLVGTYDGTNIKLYINGTAATLDTSVSGATSSTTGNIGVSRQSFYLGGNPGDGNVIYNFSSGTGVNAVFDDALIFDRAITESEVTSNYSGDITLGNKTDLLLYYDFEGVAEEQIAMSVTDGVTTYYTSLSDAVAAASTTTTTTITLLKDTTENITISNALSDTIIDLNENRLTGKIINSNASSRVTLKNGTIAGDGNATTDNINNVNVANVVTNFGTMTIESGTYINGTTNGHCVSNPNGTLNIEDGLFSLTNKSSNASTIYNNNFNDIKGVTTVTGGTIDTVGHGFVNNGGTTKITDMTIKVSTTGRTGLINRESGTTNVYTSTIDASAAIQNPSGTLVVRESDVLGSIGGIVYRFGWNSSTMAEWQIYGQSDAACAVWTATDGQDDIIWTTASSYTGTYNTYLYCRIYKSDHNNESGTYNTHLYNAAHTTYYYGTSFTMP